MSKEEALEILSSYDGSILPSEIGQFLEAVQVLLLILLDESEVEDGG